VSVQAAKEVIPQPVLVDGVCDYNTATRTIAVRLSELEEAGGRTLWKECHAALSRSEEVGWRGQHPLIYASAPGAFQVAYVTPGEFWMLLVRFPSGVSAFSELIGKPRLVARVAMDRSSRRFISVNFKHVDP
jgi:hypothetical protein